MISSVATVPHRRLRFMLGRSTRWWPSAQTRGTLLVIFLLGLMALGWGADRRPMPPASGSSLLGRPTAPLDSPRLRVAAFNIHGGRDAVGRHALPRSADALRGFHWIGLNEVRGSAPWRMGNQAAELGQLLDLAWIYAPSERRWWNAHWGNAILAAVPVRHWEIIPLAGTRGKAYRNLVYAQIDWDGTTVHALVTHIDTADDHDHQLAAAAERFMQLPEPALLMGDLNARRDDPQLARMLAGGDVCDGVGQFAEDDPSTRIDWILVRGAAVTNGGMIDVGSSDHPCVWVELTR